MHLRRPPLAAAASAVSAAALTAAAATVSGIPNFAPSSGVSALTVAPVSATTTFREVVIVPVGTFAVELVSAQVSSPGGSLIGPLLIPI